MPELLRMPEVAAGATSAILSQWVVPEGHPYQATEVIAVIETDKAVVDVEAESAGVILRTLVPAGTEVQIGAAIALIGGPDEQVTDIDAQLAALGQGAAVLAPRASGKPDAPDIAPTTSTAHTTKAPALDSPPEASRLFASPLARRLAREAGLSLKGLIGTGPNGRIRRLDVMSALETPTAPLPPTSDGPAAFTDIPHSKLRRMIAARLTQSKQSAPHFYVRGSANVDRLLALREEINSGESTRVSINDLVIKAVARAHLLVPAANVVWSDDSVRHFTSVDIAVAVSTPEGLVAPVLRGVDRLSIREVAAATRDLAARARAGALRQFELEGGSTSVTSLGMFGTEEFTAIINPPHSSILAVGATRQEPIVVDGVLAVGTVMKVTLSVDHRPMDGVTAAEWMRVFLDLIEHPARILC